ncbi:MAG: GNAT family N-acetyltransferase [Ignavibacterium sp.]|nr:MAG: GNAT family N-acetyltransferase [Ignavibacterium sp.]
MKVERLNRSDKEDAVRVLATAFHEYPVMRYILKSEGEKYESDLKALMGFFCEARLTKEFPLLGIRDGGELAATAGISEPEIKPRSPELNKVYNDLTNTIGADAIARYEAYGEKSNPRLDESHYFLGIIGVLQAHQGKGYAKQIIEEVQRLSETHPTSKGVCLCTEDPPNVPLYEHLGYKVISEADVEDVHTWAMFRENRK